MPDALPPTTLPLAWKSDWPTARRHHLDWWQGKGLVFWCTAPADQPHEDLPDPGPPPSIEDLWYGPSWLVMHREYQLSRTCFAGDSFPILGGWSGAGDLAAYLGCPVQLDEATIWYDPVIGDPDAFTGPIRLDPDNPALGKSLRLVELAVERSAGRYLVSQPDLVENIDILAALRGTQDLLMDMIERPDWVLARLSEINAAYCEVFDLFYQRIRDSDGGNTFRFNIWGPGRTAKVQCDASAMFGPDMFRRFVAPFLEEQCRGLDYAMYHLDGEDALPNLDALLEIESIQAIEWTPKLLYTGEGGGHPKWYDLYRRILAAGKSVQAIGVHHEQVIPLLDAVGGAGMYITTHAPNAQTAQELAQRVNAYRPAEKP